MQLLVAVGAGIVAGLRVMVLPVLQATGEPVMLVAVTTALLWVAETLAFAVVRLTKQTPFER